MLSIKTMLGGTIQYSSRHICRATVRCCAPSLARVQSMDKRGAHTVPEQYIVDEEDAEKYQLSPEIKALEKYLTYSEYVESKKLRSGYKNNKITLNRLKAKAQARKEALGNAPVYSVMLKHLDKNRERTAEPEISEECEISGSGEIGQPAKSVHMPYAATDAFDSVQVPSASESELGPSGLNLEYKLMYEKYLELKQSRESAGFGSDDRNDRHSEIFAADITGKRPRETIKNVPADWMNDYEQFNDAMLSDASWKSNYGTPNPNIPVSNVPCGGCGALLHCKDAAIPGYLPFELFENVQEEVLKSSVCQRCHFIKHYNTTLEVKVSPDDYPALLSHIKTKKVAVILMVDLTDFPCSIWPGIMDIIGKTTNVFVVGNKIDLLPSDSKQFLSNVEKSLIKSLNEMGIGNANIKSVSLISAKTGYGVEQLINKLHKHWEYKGDVYMIGCTNVGKSSLFNALLKSDYCKIQVADLIQRATISPWPGTTLNLLKFPILSPVSRRLWLRYKRLKSEQFERIREDQFRKDKLKESWKPKFATLQGHIGQTFESLQRTQGPGFFGTDPRMNHSGYLGFNENHEIYKTSRWCFDTPGTIHPDQVLHLLTTDELMLTLPQRIISPRTFNVRHGHTLFLAGLGRLDFIKGSYLIRCTVFASNKLPVTMCKTKYADKLYQELLRTEAFAVPINDPERLKVFPGLEPKQFEFDGIGDTTSAADVVLSSAGWVAIATEEGKRVEVKAWTPEGRGIHLRTPAMLSKSVTLRGSRIPFSPAFTLGKQVYSK